MFPYYCNYYSGKVVLFVSVIHSVSRISFERDNGRQPNMVGMGKG